MKSWRQHPAELWRVRFYYERNGLAGEIIVLARRRWRAAMATEKKLRRQGWRPFIAGEPTLVTNGKSQPTKPATHNENRHN